MKRTVSLVAVAAIVAASLAESAHAAKVRVRRGPAGRVNVSVSRGFPIHRALPNVVVRTTTVRVAPRTYLAPVAFAAVVAATLPPAQRRVWAGTEGLDREDGWTDFTVNADRRGDRLFLEVSRGAAQISFAEVVFDNGEAQVVDFNDRVVRTGLYPLLDFKDGRKVDHVRVVARSDTARSDITVHLTN